MPATPQVVLRGSQVVLFEAPRLTKGLVFLSGRRDSNPRRPPWQRDKRRFASLRTARFLEKPHEAFPERSSRYAQVGRKVGRVEPQVGRVECHLDWLDAGPGWVERGQSHDLGRPQKEGGVAGDSARP